MFKFEWKVNGEVVQDDDENNEMPSLPLSSIEGNSIEVTVSSDCGASDTATVFVIREDVTTTTTTTTGKYIHKIPE